jgi:hypothetical protein
MDGHLGHHSFACGSVDERDAISHSGRLCSPKAGILGKVADLLDDDEAVAFAFGRQGLAAGSTRSAPSNPTG